MGTPCHEKIKHANVKDANKIVEIMANKGIIVFSYKCEKCGFYHTGKLHDGVIKPWHGAKEYDLTGLHFGKFVVIGYIGKNGRKNKKTSSNRSNMWLCECICGHYEKRTSKAIRTNTDPNYACEQCQKELYLKSKENNHG